MTAQRLFGILKNIDSMERQLGLQTSLEQVRDALNQLTSQPAQPNLQHALANALSNFRAASEKMSQSISPSDAAAIQQMGGVEFIDPEIAQKVTQSIQTNAMTPSVARDFVQNLASRRATFIANVRAALESLKQLGINDSDLKAGMAAVAFLIPRDIFDGELGRFAKELTFISRLLQHFTEAYTGKTEPVTLKSLSSSVPTVTLVTDLGVLALLGTVVNKFLTAWVKVEEIRLIRGKLAELGIKDSNLKELDDRITTVVDEVVEDTVEITFSKYDGDRKHELENAIRTYTKRLFALIERGLTVEFHAEPEPNKDDPNQRILQQIADVARQLKFPSPAEEPLLLTGNVPPNGEENPVAVVKHTKKTTTHKKITSPKPPEKGAEEQ